MSSTPTNEGNVETPAAAEVEAVPVAAAAAESTIPTESNAAQTSGEAMAPPQRSPPFLTAPTGGVQGYSYWGAPPGGMEGRPGATSPSQIAKSKIQEIQHA